MKKFLFTRKFNSFDLLVFVALILFTRQLDINIIAQCMIVVILSAAMGLLSTIGELYLVQEELEKSHE